MAEYLALFANRKIVKDALIAFLQDRDKNLYEWQEAWFLWALRHSSALPAASSLLSNQVEDV